MADLSDRAIRERFAAAVAEAIALHRVARPELLPPGALAHAHEMLRRDYVRQAASRDGRRLPEFDFDKPRVVKPDGYADMGGAASKTGFRPVVDTADVAVFEAFDR